MLSNSSLAVMVIEKGIPAVWLLMVSKVKWCKEAGLTVCCWVASVQPWSGDSEAVIVGVPAVVSL